MLNRKQVLKSNQAKTLAEHSFSCFTAQQGQHQTMRSFIGINLLSNEQAIGNISIDKRCCVIGFGRIVQTVRTDFRGIHKNPFLAGGESPKTCHEWNTDVA